ncbi:MAG TPA: hypothetical protein VFR70_03655, partial [Flavobacterium sp.]|nr:hypothetical protein [Flavobacterium sp.]
MKKITLLAMLCCISFAKTLAQQTYQNGTGLERVGAMTNSSGQTVLAPAGYYFSKALQGSSYISWGSTSNSYAFADTFTVPAGSPWNINTVLFYAYQTNNTQPLPITELYMQIWNGDPSLPASSIVLGNLMTNTLDASSIENEYTYRVGYNSPSTSSKIWSFKGNLTGQLQPGTYWITWSWTCSGTIYFPDNQLSSGT